MIRPFTALALVCLSAPAFAADPNPVAKIYNDQLSGIEGELVPLIEAMPADKFTFAPKDGAFKGVRTFAAQAKHVAAVLYIVSASAMGMKPPVDLGKGEDGPESVATKEQVVKFVKDAFAFAHKAALATTAENEVAQLPSPFGSGKMARGSMIGLLTSHSFDHYGQMVVYLRMNNIIPPASR